MNETENITGERRKLGRAIIGFLLFLFMVPAMLFISAGTLQWRMAWVYVIMLLAGAVGSRLLVWRRNPDLLRERANYTEAEGTRDWDRILLVVIGMWGPVITAIVAGLDHRFNWSRQLADGIQGVAALLVALGYALGVWAMVENRFFSAVARIQSDRGQVVISSGPYRLVRHPAYLGAVIAGLAMPVMLNTCWALIPSIFLIIAVIFRTHMEDRMLIDELEEYDDYAKQTRWRLFPGIW